MALKFYKLSVLMCFIFWGFTSFAAAPIVPAPPATDKVYPEQALKIAEDSKEVKAFLNLNIEDWEDCIFHKVEKPCDSGWVTCIEDAWVVKYFLKGSCAPLFDERLGVTLLIDAKNGNIISRFPEVMYFEDQGYCMEDYDCSGSKKDGRCKN